MDFRSHRALAATPEFEVWKTLLRNDCIAADKLKVFDCLGENILRILYENGLEPTVEAISKNGLNGATERETSS